MNASLGYHRRFLCVLIEDGIAQSVHLARNLEEIRHGTFEVIAELGDVSKLDAARAVVVQLG